MAFPCARLPVLRPQPRGPSWSQRPAARGQRRTSFPVAPGGHWIHVAQPFRCRSFCASSGERRVGGLGSRAKKCVEPVVFSARSACLCLVHAPTRFAPLRADCLPVRARAPQQAAGDYISISAFAVGLLAARPLQLFGSQARAGLNLHSAEIFHRMAGFGKTPSYAAFRCQRGRHDESPARRRRHPDSGQVQPTTAD